MSDNLSLLQVWVRKDILLGVVSLPSYDTNRTLISCKMFEFIKLEHYDRIRNKNSPITMFLSITLWLKALKKKT